MIICKHSVKTQILVNLRPMNTRIRQMKIFPFFFSCMSQTRPFSKGITCPYTVVCFSINMGCINPNFYYPYLLHTNYLLKKTFHLSIITSVFSSIIDSISAISCFLNP